MGTRTDLAGAPDTSPHGGPYAKARQYRKVDTGLGGGGPGDAGREPPAGISADDVARVLDAAGLTRFSATLFLIAGLGWMADGAESAVLSYMLPSLMQQWCAVA